MFSRLVAWVAGAAVVLAGCGGEVERAPAVAQRAAGAPPDVVVVALDGLPARAFEPERLGALAPRLAAIAGERGVLVLGGSQAPGPRAAVGATPQVAELLTGTARHGLRSARELGFHRLGFDVLPAVADARALGFAPLAAVARPQLDGALTGLDGGFEAWDTVGTGTPRRTARPAEVADRSVDALARACAEPAPKLAFVQLSAPPIGEAGLPDVTDAAVVAAPFRAAAVELERELGPLEHAELVALAEAGDLAALVERFARRRGSVAAGCVDAAIADLWLVAIDAAVASALDALAPRGEPLVCVVALASSDGTAPTRILGAPAGLDPGARLADVLPAVLRAAAGADAAFDAVTAALTESLEQWGGDGVLSIAIGPDHAWRLAVRAPADGAFTGVDATVSSAPGFGETLEFEPPRRSDRVELDLEPSDHERVVTLRGPARGLPLWIELRRDGAPVPESDIAVAGRPLASVPVPRLLDGRGARLPEASADDPTPDLPPVRFVAAGAGRLALGVGDLSSATLAAWPPDPDGARPEADADGAVRVGPQRSLAVALPRGDGFVPAADFAHGDRRALGPGTVLVLPGYDDLEFERRWLFRAPNGDVMPPTASGSVHLWRPGAAFPAGPAITPAQRRFLRQLPPGE